MKTRPTQNRTIDSLTADEIAQLELMLPKVIASRHPGGAGYAATIMYHIVYPRPVAKVRRLTGRQRRAAFGGRGTGE